MLTSVYYTEYFIIKRLISYASGQRFWIFAQQKVWEHTQMFFVINEVKIVIDHIKG